MTISARTILICGPNWVGDTVMSMPAVQLLKHTDPGCHITLLVKSAVLPLWDLQATVDRVMPLEKGLLGTLRVARAVKTAAFDQAYTFSNSIRTGLVPLLARVPERRGKRGRHRSWMLTSIAEEPAQAERRHQVWEYLEILGLADRCPAPETPKLTVPPAIHEATREEFDLREGEPPIGLMPGAARGPSKRWPPAHFIEAGRRLFEELGCRIMVLGGPAETELCEVVAKAIGPAAQSTAGKTPLTKLSALLEFCPVVVSNDSGGMHLAAACGAKVVAIFGLTDPTKTGPLGPGHRTIQPAGVKKGNRVIARDSKAAMERLRSIEPDEVVEAALELWGKERG